VQAIPPYDQPLEIIQPELGALLSVDLLREMDSFRAPPDIISSFQELFLCSEEYGEDLISKSEDMAADMKKFADAIQATSDLRSREIAYLFSHFLRVMNPQKYAYVPHPSFVSQSHYFCELFKFQMQALFSLLHRKQWDEDADAIRLYLELKPSKVVCGVTGYIYALSAQVLWRKTAGAWMDDKGVDSYRSNCDACFLRLSKIKSEFKMLKSAEEQDKPKPESELPRSSGIARLFFSCF